MTTYEFAHELMDALERRGVTFVLVDGKLAIDAPAGVLTDDLREQLRHHRPEMLHLARAAFLPAPPQRPAPPVFGTGRAA